MPFVDTELARRFEAFDARMGMECAQIMKRLRPEYGADYEEIAGGWAGFSGVESPLTQAIGLGMNGPVTEDDMDRLEHFYHSRGAAVRLIVCPFADVSLVELMNKRGYHLAEFENTLYHSLEADESNKPAPTNLEIEKVAREAEPVWTQTVAKGFVGQEEVPAFLIDCMPLMFHMDGAESFLARIDGEPAGGASMAIWGNLAALFGAGTLVEFRNRGIQTALLKRRLEIARTNGCDLAVVGTKPGSISQRNVERQGFRLAYTRVAMVLDIKA